MDPKDIILALDYDREDFYIFIKFLDYVKSQLAIVNSKHCMDVRTIRNNLFLSFNYI